MKDLKQLALRYFADHPGAKRVVIEKAMALQQPSANAASGSGIDISGVIRAEEENYFASVQRCRRIVLANYSDASKLTGATLAMLHHTLGCDPTVVEEILGVNLPSSLHDAYLAVYAAHKLTGKRGFVPVVVRAKV